MIQMVHWKDLVPEDFMAEFIRIEKALAFAKRNNRLVEAESDIEKKNSDSYEKWRKIRWKMRHAGYESKIFGEKTLWNRRGWLGTANILRVDKKEDLQFRYYANSDEKPLFISVQDLKKFEEELFRDVVEDDYYKRVRYLETKIIKKPKPRGMNGFTHEED